MMGFIQRTEHEMTRADGYGYLLALAKHEVPLQEASVMLLQWLWALWGVSYSACIPSIQCHRHNKNFIKRELRQRRITNTPDSEPNSSYLQALCGQEAKYFWC